MAPNLYSRPGGFPRFCVTQMVRYLANNTIDQLGVKDLKAAIAYLQQQNFVKGESIGVVGFCLGGGYSLLLACASDQVKASVVFYGRNPAPLDSVASVQCPVLNVYGERDRFVRGGAPKLREAMERHGKQYREQAYPTAGHSFMNDRWRGYRPDVAADAWDKMVAFFREHLGNATG